MALLFQPFSVLGAPRVGAISTTVFSDSFESVTEFDSWTAVGARWDVVSSAGFAQDGSKRADYTGSADNTGAELVKQLDTTGYENIVLSFYYKKEGLKASDYGEVAIRVAETEVVLAKYEGETGSADDDVEWQHASFSVPEASNQTDVQFVFRGFGTSSSNKFKIDNIALIGEEISTPVDEQSPVVQLIEPLEPAVNPELIQVSATDDTQLASARIVISNESGVVDECSRVGIALAETLLDCDTSGIAEGKYTATFTATDAAGNTSEPGVLQFVIDHTKPSLSIVIPEDGLVSNLGALHVSGTASDALTEIDRVEYKIQRVTGIAGPAEELLYEGTANGTTEWEIHALSLASGTYRVSVTAYDTADNYRTQAHDVQIDTAVPTVSIVSPQTDNEIQASDFTVTARASDFESGVSEAKVDLYAGTQLLSYVQGCNSETFFPSVAATEFSCSVDVSAIPAGNYALRFTALDQAGNMSEPVFWKFRILSGTIVVAPSIPAGKGNQGAASNGVVNRQVANTVIVPRNTTQLARATVSSSSKKLAALASQDSATSQRNNTGVLAAVKEASQTECSNVLGVCWTAGHVVLASAVVVSAVLLAGYATIKRARA